MSWLLKTIDSGLDQLGGYAHFQDAAEPAAVEPSPSVEGATPAPVRTASPPVTPPRRSSGAAAAPSSAGSTRMSTPSSIASSARQAQRHRFVRLRRPRGAPTPPPSCGLCHGAWAGDDAAKLRVCGVCGLVVHLGCRIAADHGLPCHAEGAAADPDPEASARARNAPGRLFLRPKQATDLELPSGSRVYLQARLAPWNLMVVSAAAMSDAEDCAPWEPGLPAMELVHLYNSPETPLPVLELGLFMKSIGLGLLDRRLATLVLPMWPAMLNRDAKLERWFDFERGPKAHPGWKPPKVLLEVCFVFSGRSPRRSIGDLGPAMAPLLPPMDILQLASMQAIEEIRRTKGAGDNLKGGAPERAASGRAERTRAEADVESMGKDGNDGDDDDNDDNGDKIDGDDNGDTIGKSDISVDDNDDGRSGPQVERRKAGRGQEETMPREPHPPLEPTGTLRPKGAAPIRAANDCPVTDRTAPSAGGPQAPNLERSRKPEPARSPEGTRPRMPVQLRAREPSPSPERPRAPERSRSPDKSPLLEPAPAQVPEQPPQLDSAQTRERRQAVRRFAEESRIRAHSPSAEHSPTPTSDLASAESAPTESRPVLEPPPAVDERPPRETQAPQPVTGAGTTRTTNATATAIAAPLPPRHPSPTTPPTLPRQSSLSFPPTRRAPSRSSGNGETPTSAMVDTLKTQPLATRETPPMAPTPLPNGDVPVVVSPPSPGLSERSTPQRRTSRSNSATLDQNAHLFRVNTYTTPTWCAICDRLLLGLASQGYRCEVCNLDVHRGCQLQALAGHACRPLTDGPESTSDLLAMLDEPSRASVLSRGRALRLQGGVGLIKLHLHSAHICNARCHGGHHGPNSFSGDYYCRLYFGPLYKALPDASGRTTPPDPTLLKKEADKDPDLDVIGAAEKALYRLVNAAQSASDPILNPWAKAVDSLAEASTRVAPLTPSLGRKLHPSRHADGHVVHVAPLAERDVVSARTPVVYQSSNPVFDHSWTVGVPHYQWGVSIDVVNATSDKLVGRVAFSAHGLLQRQLDRKLYPHLFPTNTNLGTLECVPLLGPQDDLETPSVAAGFGKHGHVNLSVTFLEDWSLFGGAAPRALPLPPKPDFSLDAFKEHFARIGRLLAAAQAAAEAYGRLVRWDDPVYSIATLVFFSAFLILGDAEHFGAAIPLALVLNQIYGWVRRVNGSFRTAWVSSGTAVAEALALDPHGEENLWGKRLSTLRISVVAARGVSFATPRVACWVRLLVPPQPQVVGTATPGALSIITVAGQVPRAGGMVTFRGGAKCAFPLLIDVLRSCRAPAFDDQPLPDLARVHGDGSPAVAAAAAATAAAERTHSGEDSLGGKKPSPLPTQWPRDASADGGPASKGRGDPPQPARDGGDPCTYFPLLLPAGRPVEEGPTLHFQLFATRADRHHGEPKPLGQIRVAIADIHGRDGALEGWFPVEALAAKAPSAAPAAVYLRLALDAPPPGPPRSLEHDALRAVQTIVYDRLETPQDEPAPPTKNGIANLWGIRDTVLMAQHLLGDILDHIERFLNLCRWAQPRKSIFALYVYFLLYLATSLVPTRLLLLALLWQQFTSALLFPAASPVPKPAPDNSPGNVAANFWLSLPTHEDLRRFFGAEHRQHRDGKDQKRIQNAQRAARYGVWKPQWAGTLRLRPWKGNGGSIWPQRYLVLQGRKLLWWYSEAAMDRGEEMVGSMVLEGHAGVAPLSPTEAAEVLALGEDAVARTVVVFGKAGDADGSGAMRRQAMLFGTPEEAMEVRQAAEAGIGKDD